MTLDGREIAFRVGAPGRHWVGNALGVVACAAALGADPEGRRVHCRTSERRWAAATASAHPAERADHLIDESYNANPASVRAALQVLATAAGRASPRSGHARARRSRAEAARRARPSGHRLRRGPGLHGRAGDAHLHDALPAARRAGHVADGAALLPILEGELRGGDTLLIKGSLGMRMGRIVEALLARGQAERPVGAQGN